MSKAERWLRSWARVNTKKGDRRLMDVARALNRQQIVRLLEEYEHINEFVCATFACDVKTMMNLLALGKGAAFCCLLSRYTIHEVLRGVVSKITEVLKRQKSPR